jgi:hypothetical protein
MVGKLMKVHLKEGIITDISNCKSETFGVNNWISLETKDTDLFLDWIFTDIFWKKRISKQMFLN